MPENTDKRGEAVEMSICYRSSIRRHYLKVDEERLETCEINTTFVRNMFKRYNEIINDILRLIDEGADRDSRPRLG